jgi:membrane protease YdiL (CAAX protease family)
MSDPAPPPRRPRKLHPLPGTLLFGLSYVAASVLVVVLLSVWAGIDLAREGLEPDVASVTRWVGQHVLLASLLTAAVTIPLTRGFGGWLAGLDRRTFGLEPQGGRRAAAIGALLGLAALLVPAALGRLTGLYEPLDPLILDERSGGSALPGIAWVLPVLLVMAFAEELLLRGFLLRYWQPQLGAKGAILLSSLAFAALHAGNPNLSVMGLLGIFLAGLMLAVAFVATDSLWFVTGIHAGWNVATALVVGLPVSGLTLPSLARWQVADSATAERFMGGDFGPEEGLAFHLSLTATLVAVLVLAPAIRRARPERDG